jgi:hypothetical protein
MRQLLSSCDCHKERLLQATDDNAAAGIVTQANKPNPLGTVAVSFALTLRREARAFPTF